MNRISNLSTLQKGDRVFTISCGLPKQYTFEGEHPRFKGFFVLASETSTMMISVPYKDLVSGNYYTGASDSEIAEKRIEWHKKEIEILEKYVLRFDKEKFETDYNNKNTNDHEKKDTHDPLQGDGC